MSKSQSPSDRARTERRQGAAPAPQPAAARRLPYRAVAFGILLAGLAVGAYVGCHQATTQKESAGAELDLCRHFMVLKNSRDRAADDLLGPAPAVPAEAVTPEEAGRLQAEFFLRGDCRVVSVRPEKPEDAGPDARFVLTLKGSLSSPPITQAGSDGTHVVSRTMSDPEVVVRVADGKIRATEARMPHDDNEKPVSEEEKRRFKQGIDEQQRRLLEMYQGTQRSGGR
jgi:hypothetical protein